MRWMLLLMTALLLVLGLAQVLSPESPPPQAADQRAATNRLHEPASPHTTAAPTDSSAANRPAAESATWSAASTSSSAAMTQPIPATAENGEPRAAPHEAVPEPGRSPHDLRSAGDEAGPAQPDCAEVLGGFDLAQMVAYFQLSEADAVVYARAYGFQASKRMLQSYVCYLAGAEPAEAAPLYELLLLDAPGRVQFLYIDESGLSDGLRHVPMHPEDHAWLLQLLRYRRANEARHMPRAELERLLQRQSLREEYARAYANP